MVVEIFCKPYVAAYLRNHFENVRDSGIDSVDLGAKKFVEEFFRNALSRRSTRYDVRTTLHQYTERVCISISNDDYERYGCFISKTSMLAFNSFLEQHIKSSCRIYVGLLHRNRGMMKAKAIRRFQEECGFTENDFPVETIKKDIDRHVDFENLFRQHNNRQLSLF